MKEECRHLPKEECELCSDQGPLILLPRCHLTAPLQASYADGVLTLRCYVPECHRIVATYEGGKLCPPK